MIITVYPSTLQGSILAAASKSSMQRALAAALLHKGKTNILNPGHSNDDRSALDTIRKLGATVTEEEGRLVVQSQGVRPVSPELNLGESGLGIRMFTPIAALSPADLTITGSGSLVTRPMDFFDGIFPDLGIAIRSNNGRLPLHIRGPLQPADITVDGSLSSQFLTGLLMAFAASGAEGRAITVRDLKSKPYIDLTLRVLNHFGWNVQHQDYEKFQFLRSEHEQYPEITYQVEGDWSGAAFILVGGAIAGDIAVTGLDPESTQADKAVLDALRDAGADMTVAKDQIRIRTGRLAAFRFDATECPDLFPPLVALAAYAKGTTVISGTTRLTHKESNRALTLQEEFAKLGISIILEGDRMLIEGGGPVRGAAVTSHHDHRIAMACAVAAMGADGPVEITDAEAVNKSYPDFYAHISRLGAKCVEYAGSAGHHLH